VKAVPIYKGEPAGKAGCLIHIARPLRVFDIAREVEAAQGEILWIGTSAFPIVES